MAFRDTRNKQFLTANTMEELKVKMEDYEKRGWRVISDIHTRHGQYTTHKVLVEYQGK